MSNKKANYLINEKSPYLLQHAYNPVQWYPWSDEAFDVANKENKPIFLSIGYSTCHWCHVMAEESFEDPEVADLMNKIFIPIKVDREERPDLDSIYMNVCQLLTGRGGWPLTIFLTPDKKPFFAGTYIPKDSSMGRTGLLDLLPRINKLWQEKRKDIIESAEKIIDSVQKFGEFNPGEIDPKILDQAFIELQNNFDSKYGGFGKAPKFPMPHQIIFLLRYWYLKKDTTALQMVEKTLQALRAGGIFDQIGFGFHRYSTDRKWLVPHFEKMLYDQALLLMAYTEAYQATGNNLYKRVAEEIITYVNNKLTSNKGAFFSAEDANSEGVEGKYYLWSEEEINAKIDRKDVDSFLKDFSILPEGNYEEEVTGRKTGKNILHIKVEGG